MAEELAKTNLGLKSLKLVSCHKSVKNSLDQASDTSPTEKVLSRQVTHLKAAWKEYEEGMLKLQEVAADENMASYQELFEKDYTEFNTTCQRAEEFLDRYNVPEEEEAPDYAALAAANAQVRADHEQDMEDVLVDAEASLESPPSATLHTHVESLLRSVEDKLSQIFVSTQEAGNLLDPAAKAVVQSDFQALKRSTLARVRKARHKMSTSPMPANTASTNSTSSRGRSDTDFARSYFQRQPFPKFSGESRDYLAFRKEWRETVTPSHDETFQLREIRRAVPSKLQPDLKNLRSMNEVWAVLDEEFGQVLDNVSGLVRRLLAFKLSKEAKTESNKFMELSRLWNEICADLRELDKLEALNHEPTIAAVGGCFPA